MYNMLDDFYTNYLKNHTNDNLLLVDSIKDYTLIM